MSAEPRLEANLASLAARDPALAALVGAAAATPPPPSETPDDAARAVRGIAAQPGPGGLGPPVLVLGAGDGRRVNAVRARLDAGRSRQPIVVLEQTPERLRAALSAGDWTAALADERVRVAVDRDLLRAARRAFDDDEAFWLQGAQFQVGSAALEGVLNGSAPANPWRRLLHAAQRDLQETVARLDAGRRAWAEARAARDPARPPRFLAVAERNTSALRFIYRDFARAAASLDVPFHLHEEDYLHDPFRAHRRLRAVLAAQPDALLCLVRTGMETLGPLAGDLPAVVYYSSDPQRYDLSPAVFRPQDRVFVADPRWRATLAALGIPAAVLPLATGLHHAPRPADLSPWRCDAALVCNLTGPRDLVPDLDVAAERAIDELGRALADGAPGDADALVAASPLARDERPDRRLARTVEVSATRHARIGAAVRLAAAGLDVRVHGNAAWRDALAGTAADGAWHGPLDYEHEVPAAYAGARTVVNVGSRSAPEALNMRAFDVPAVGGCLVTDLRPGLAEAFVPGREVEAYRDLDELVDLVGALVADPARRDAVAAAGRARARCDHSYEARWPALLAAVADAEVGLGRA